MKTRRCSHRKGAPLAQPRRFAGALGLLGLLLAPPGAIAQSGAADLDALFARSVGAISRDIDAHWAYTESTSGTEGDRVGRYDPRRADGERWELLSIDGRPPTDAEAARYAAEKRDDGLDDEDAGEAQGADEGEIEAMIQPGSLRLLEETDDYWLLSFLPLDMFDDLGDDAGDFLESVVRISKHGEFLEQLEIRNTKPFKPETGVRIKHLLTRLTFGPVGPEGQILPLSAEIVVDLRAFLVMHVEESESIRYSDYELAN